MAMTRLAASVPFELRGPTRQIMGALYFKNAPRTPFLEDAFNRQLSEIGDEKVAQYEAEIFIGAYQKLFKRTRHFWLKKKLID